MSGPWAEWLIRRGGGWPLPGPRRSPTIVAARSEGGPRAGGMDMTTPTVAAHPSVAIPRPELHLAGKACVALLVLLGLGALAGGIALMAAPDGSVMHFSVALLAGSPFADFTIPGLILGGLFGIGSFVVAGPGARARAQRAVPRLRDRLRADDLDQRGARDHRRVQLPPSHVLRGRAAHRRDRGPVGLADVQGLARRPLTRRRVAADASLDTSPGVPRPVTGSPPAAANPAVPGP